MAVAANASAVRSLPVELERRSRWSDELLARHRIEVRDVPLVSIGGGLASFALIDHLRIAGVPAESLAVLGPDADPAENYRTLATNSQIPSHERLRSDAGSTIDNPWGFPSYAMREAWRERKVGPVWRVAVEPLLAEYYTPRAGEVYAAVDREAKRIGWSSMLQQGWVRTARRRVDGGYFILFQETAASGGGPLVAYRSRFVHLGVGYPGIALLPDLADFRRRFPHWAHRVVHAYEPHEHLYDELRAKPSTVVVRGSGIVASRVLQRLLDDRDRGAGTTIVHLFRNYVAAPQGRRPWFRRPGSNGFAFQAFNYPKAAWGGQLRSRLSALDGSPRAELLDQMGGTNTAPRRQWRQQLRRAGRAGAYRQAVGAVRSIEPHDCGISVVVQHADGSEERIDASHVLDATGLLADLSEHRLLSDLIAHGGARRNPKGRLDVDPSFELRGTSSGGGHMFASGAMTLGGHYAGVDSFLGMQYAAVQIADRLASLGFGRRVGPAVSMRGWLRWMRNQELR